MVSVNNQVYWQVGLFPINLSFRSLVKSICDYEKKTKGQARIEEAEAQVSKEEAKRSGVSGFYNNEQGRFKGGLRTRRKVYAVGPVEQKKAEGPTRQKEDEGPARKVVVEG